MSAFTQIARDLRSGYTIGFAPRDTGEGGFRSIRVVADAGAFTGRLREHGVLEDQAGPIDKTEQQQ